MNKKKTQVLALITGLLLLSAPGFPALRQGTQTLSDVQGGITYMPSDHYRDSIRTHILEQGSATVDCYFAYPIGDSVIDPDFGNNAQELSVLRRFLHYALEDTLVCVYRVNITGYSSIDGNTAINEHLSLGRARRLLKMLDADYNLSGKYPVEVRGTGADWTKLRQLIAASSYSWAADALRIIDGIANTEWKKLQLAQLGGGRAKDQLYELYPQLRRVEIKITYDVQCMKTKLHRVGFLNPSDYAVRVLKLKSINTPLKKPFNPVLAVKTNLLFDVAMMPNVEVEISLGRRWSVNGEYTFPWWLIDNDRYCLQLLSGGAEVRYWMGNRYHHRPLTGHFAGLYAGGGKYDLQWKESGYQGEFFIAAGLSYGYSVPLSKRLNMEFSLGIGLMRTNYRHYHMQDNYQTLLWQNNGRYTWFGPTKAKVSLVWLIGNKKGGKK